MAKPITGGCRCGALRYSCAAHPHPVLIRAGGKQELLDRGGTIIGLDGAVPFEEGEAQLEAGDRLYLYTDGITDQPDEDGEAFGPDRLSELLRDHHSEPRRTGSSPCVNRHFARSSRRAR